jgi:hypothetical protein
MNHDPELEEKPLEDQLQAIAIEVHSLATNHQGNALALLELLRALEQWHRDIREEMFQSALPDNRQALYALLRDIEESGGWPYIDRIKLRSLLKKLQEEMSYPRHRKAEAGEQQLGGNGLI